MAPIIGHDRTLVTTFLACYVREPLLLRDYMVQRVGLLPNG